MEAVSGIYKNGTITLDNEYVSDGPVKVIVTFLEEIEVRSKKVLTTSDFYFKKSQAILKKVKGSLSDVIIEERRSDL